jgi:hypothetical protein
MKRNSENCVAIEAICNNILLGPLSALIDLTRTLWEIGRCTETFTRGKADLVRRKYSQGGSIEQGKKGLHRTVQCGRVRNAQPKSTLPVSRTRGPQLSIQGVKVRTWVSVRKGWAAVDCGPVLTGDGDTPLYFIN